MVVKGYLPALQKKYKEEIVPRLMKEFGYKSIMQVPKLEKIILNEGVGSATADKKLIDVAQSELTLIAGQKAVQTVSRKDISNFKLRRGMPIGVKVTLRSAKMYEFLDRLISIALPRIRDFKGIAEKTAGQLYPRDQGTDYFPEIDIDKISRYWGSRSRSLRRRRRTKKPLPCCVNSGYLSKILKKDNRWQKSQ